MKIKVTNGPSPETVELLKKGIIDFGVVSLPLTNSEGLEVLEVKNSGLLCSQLQV